jgi:hypothetical protein
MVKRKSPLHTVTLPERLYAALEAERRPGETKSAQTARLLMQGLGYDVETQLSIMRGEPAPSELEKVRYQREKMETERKYPFL